MVLIKSQDVIERSDRARGRLLRRFVDEVSVVGADLVRLAARRPDLRKIGRAPEPLIRRAHEIKLAVLAGQAEVDREPEQIEVRSAGSSAEHVLHQHLVGERLFLLLNVVFQPPQIATAEPRHALLEHPLLAEIGNAGVLAQSLTDHVGQRLVIHIGELGYRNRGHLQDARRRRLIDDQFVGQRLNVLKRFDRHLGCWCAVEDDPLFDELHHLWQIKAHDQLVDIAPG